jgi:hypothetical protein
MSIMRRWIFPLVLATFVGLMVWTVHVAGQVTVVVESDRVRIGPTEWVPRCLGAPGCIEVGAGETLTVPPGRLDVTTLLVLPGGDLDRQCGSEVVISDVPIDTGSDPFQWSHGIVNFGTHRSVCQYKTPFVELPEDAQVGTTSLTLAEVPVGWVPGDELLLPDTRQIGAFNSSTPPNREPTVTIAGLSGTTLTLSAPLTYAHLSVRDPDGGLVLRPRVANLTRDTIIRSENPNGTRGHTVNIGADASWDVQGTDYIGMGRTRNAVRNNTSADLSHIGTNQIGKYADHDHQTGSSLAVRRSVGNVYREGQGISWAKAIHGTHDTVIEDNVCVDFAGSCFVTEDGPEIRNVFRGNVAAFVAGNGKEARKNVEDGCPGCEGSGFWFRGLHNVIEGNEAWNSAVGINVFSQFTTSAQVPSEPGGAPDTPFNANDAVPISFARNVTLSNALIGLEYWGARPFPAEDHISAHNRNSQVWGAQLEGNNIHLVNPRLIASAGRGDCIRASAAYLESITIEGGELRGCNIGISGGMASQSVLLTGVLIQAVDNLIYASLDKPASAVFDRVIHRQLGSNPKKYIRYGDGSIWQPGTPVPKFGFFDWYRHRGARHEIRDWQGTGIDYVLMANQQKRSTAAWPTSATGSLTNRFFVPVEGLTMGQAWDQFGMAFEGDVVNDGDLIPLEGVSGGGGRLGLARMLGLPRAVMTLPNMLAPCAVTLISGQPGCELFLMRTGIVGAATGSIWISIDGGAPAEATQVSAGDLLRYVSRVVSDGTHDVRAWRQYSDGSQVVGSEATFGYFVGAGGPPPPPPPPPPDTEICGDGIDNDNDGLIDEDFVPPAVSVSLLDPAVPTAVFLDAAGCRLVK